MNKRPHEERINRQRDIIKKYLEDGLTYSDAGRALNISRQRAHQIINGNYSRREALRKTGKCFFCQSGKNIEIHHRDKDDTNNTDKNLVILCRSCHRKLHLVLT